MPFPCDFLDVAIQKSIEKILPFFVQGDKNMRGPYRGRRIEHDNIIFYLFVFFRVNGGIFDKLAFIAERANAAGSIVTGRYGSMRVMPDNIEIEETVRIQRKS